MTVEVSKAVRIMTYNIHSCIGMDGKLSPDRIISIIRSYQPDVICFQEIDKNCRRSGFEDQPWLIADQLKYHHCVYLHARMAGGNYGNAVLSRYPMSLVKQGRLPDAKNFFKSGLKRVWAAAEEPRGALWVRIQMNGVGVHVVNTHLSLYPRGRYMQIRELLGNQWLGSVKDNDPVLLCGDLNTWEYSSAYGLLVKTFRDAQKDLPLSFPSATYPGFAPFLRIDHVMVKGPVRSAGCFVPVTRAARIASDHLPVVVDAAFSD